MSKLIIIGFVLLIIIAIIVWKLNKGKKNVIILGQEMADASEKERLRIDSGNYGKSPLPNFDYSKWPNEQGLINPIENELDSTIKELCKDFKDYNKEKRNEIRKSISQNEIYTLLGFSKRATLFGVRKNKSSYIDYGFVSISMIESERCDYRDVLVTLSFLNYGVQKLNLNDKIIFDTAIQLSEENTGNIIKQFLERPKEKSLEIMGGYTEIETLNGIGFIQTNFEKYNPEKDLVKILFDISEYISDDKYRKGEITMGEKIAPFWLSADNDKKIERVVSEASGCASLSTRLKNEFYPKSDAQVLLLYLAEFKDKESLQVLSRQVNANAPSTFCRLTFVEGNIFCLMIQRAIWANVENYETNESLKRFEAALRELVNNDNPNNN